MAKILREHGFTEARRGQQFSGANGDPDVVGIPHYHLEVKSVEHLNIYEAMEQSKRDAREGEIPVVIFKKNNKEILVATRFEDWLRDREKERENHGEIQ